MSRINWGHLLKKPPDVQLAEVRAWLDGHEPSDPGYAAASRWLARRERDREIIERNRPMLEKWTAELKKSRSTS